MYQLNEDSYYILEQLKNKVGFIRRINDAGVKSTQHAIVTSEQIATIFNEMEIQLDEVMNGIEITPQKSSTESSE